MEFSEQIQKDIRTVKQICQLIENGQAYVEKLNDSLQEINKTFNRILSIDNLEECAISKQFMIQVLKDIVYGVENKDSVIILDVLRHGLLGIYDDVEQLLMEKGQNE